jgi:hypothetical protein
MALEMKYFVLKPKSKFLGDPYAKASRKAMRIYADMINHEDQELAKSLRKWADEEDNKALNLT